MRRIPKKIHLCWLSGDPFPELISKCISSWREFLPDYEIILWDRHRFDIQGTLWVEEAYNAKKYAFAADYIRLYALFHEGGIYLDADVEVKKNFDELLNQNSFIGYESNGDLEPAVIGAVAQCDWISKCLAYYEGRSFLKDNGEFNDLPLPIVIEKTLRSANLLPDITPAAEITCASDITFYPAEFFSPKDIYTGVANVTPATYTVHHFDGQWVKTGIGFKAKRTLHLAVKILLGPVVHRKLVLLVRKVLK